MVEHIRVLMARIHGFFRARHLAREFDEEIEAHLAMAEEEKIRQGMTPEEARRSARIELGGVTQLREAGRDARGLPWLDAHWLDIKLGIRMLRKSWGLTLVGGAAMAIVIAIGAGVFNFFDTVLGNSLPLDEGERVVALMAWDPAANRRQMTSIHDFERWRDTLRSVETLGAFRQVERQLSLEPRAPGAPGGLAQTVSVAEITAPGLQVARVAPVLGRALTDDDAHAAADPVLVLGHGVWRSRFASDPAVLGRRVRLDQTWHTVVGVMPEGFAFPVDHQFWTPLRARAVDHDHDRAPRVFAFARLAPGVTLERAQAELTAVGLLPSSAPAEGQEQASPRVVPYPLAFVSTESGDEHLLAGIMLVLVVLLLLPPCANIAILVYARTVTRQEEIAARYVLGASRRRIVVQLFVEILVLSMGASAIALMLVKVGGDYFQDTVAMGGGVPFWIEFGQFSWETVLFTVGLALVAALIAGVVPALQATGRLMNLGLRALGSRTGMRLGPTWTTLIVGQIAFSVAVLPSALSMVWGTLRPGVLGPGFAAEEFLTARLEIEPEVAPDSEVDSRPSFDTRFAALQEEFVRQLESTSGGLDITLSSSLLGREPWARVEVEAVEVDAVEVDAVASGKGEQPAPFIADFVHVDDRFFGVFGMPLLAGREFEAGDPGAEQSVVVVNLAMAQHLTTLGPSGEEVLGRRLRYLLEKGQGTVDDGPWYEIVGVVDDLPKHTENRVVYHPMVPGAIHPVSLAVRRPTADASMAERLREVAVGMAPTLRLAEVRSLDGIYRENQREDNLPAYALAAVTFSVLLLSAAGMYALMAFTVNQRRREMGIRAALGAQPVRLMMDILRHAFSQVTMGALGGFGVASLLAWLLPIEIVGGRSIPGIIPAAALLMITVGIFAAMASSRRGLRGDPLDALREG